jgi:hypothetical protein
VFISLSRGIFPVLADKTVETATCAPKWLNFSSLGCHLRIFKPSFPNETPMLLHWFAIEEHGNIWARELHNEYRQWRSENLRTFACLYRSFLHFFSKPVDGSKNPDFHTCRFSLGKMLFY